jgi:hypothetical protein|uniref:Uncharacterized protein n=1 Tax=Sipha flava TaxID=143950 RepID=A0A2S2QRU9_9HEMI
MYRADHHRSSGFKTSDIVYLVRETEGRGYTGFLNMYFLGRLIKTLCLGARVCFCGRPHLKAMTTGFLILHGIIYTNVSSPYTACIVYIDGVSESAIQTSVMLGRPQDVKIINYYRHECNANKINQLTRVDS